MSERTFNKYNIRGAYHWGMISSNPRKHVPFVKARYSLCLRLLDDVKNQQILDLGCGDGALSGLIARSGGIVAGVDPNPEGIRLAKNQFELRGLKGKFFLSSAELHECTFDKIVCTEVIEHVAKPEEILAEIHRLLKPGGFAVVSTPIRLSEQPLDHEHVIEYFPSEFISLFRDRFEIIEAKQYIPVCLHELSYMTGVFGRMINFGLKILSCWFKWNYILELKGNYKLYSLQFVKVTPVK